MAISKNNIATLGLMGRIGSFVFRQWYGKTVVAKKQSPYYSSSPAQSSHRQLFKRASLYAKNVMLHPELLQFYQSRIRGGQRAYNLALADYFHPPQIIQVDTSAFNGSAGSTITTKVTDNGKVVSVMVRIEKADGNLLEEGNAIQQEDGLHWKFSVSNHHIQQGTIIKVIAIDLAGRSSVSEIMLES